MITSKEKSVAIGSDAPQIDPALDAFGYASFASRIAEAIRNTPSPHGLVMAIHGPWGVGKTSFLNYVKHYLNNPPKSTPAPILIDFNPWWFSSTEHLATQFISQFRSKVIKESEVLRKAGDAMADYAGTIGKAISLTYGIPWLDKPISFILRLFRRKKKEVPDLKQEISKALKDGDRRIVFFIDDIDRLHPDEIREVFKVIKALADFPNVIYLLAFDRKVVADALGASLGIEGESYLEKIVQAPFSLPAVDSLLLRKKLFADLDQILESCPLREFNQTFWGNVYFDGLDQYIEIPRDIVRVINSLAVTYPAVAGEVNAIDFIALEFLRIFEPQLYTTIRDNRDSFAGSYESSYGRDNGHEKNFHQEWLETVPPKRREGVRQLVTRLFPRLESVFGNTHYGSHWSEEWRRSLRICSPQIFNTFFQFGVSPDLVSRTELDHLVAVAEEPEKVRAILLDAADTRRADGTSKAREILERLRDVVPDLSQQAARGLLQALFDVGDNLLTPADEQGPSGIPNRLRLEWTVERLLKQIADPLDDLLLELAERGRSLTLVIQIVDRIESLLANTEKESTSLLSNITMSGSKTLQQVAVRRLSELSPLELLQLHEFPSVLRFWSRWGSEDAVCTAVKPLWDSEETIPVVLESFLTFGTRQTVGDRVARRVPHLNPDMLKPYVDILALESRVQKLELATLTATQRTAVETFLKSMKRLAAGKSLDPFFLDDDD